MKKIKIGFIGPGVTGFPMAGHLAAAGGRQDAASLLRRLRTR